MADKTLDAPSRGAVMKPAKYLAALRELDAQMGVPVVRGIEYGEDSATESGRRIFTANVRLARIEAPELEAAYRRSGLIFKGINQKARDTVKAGFTLVPDDEEPATAKRMALATRAWMRLTKWRPKSEQAVREGYWAGDGFLELGFPGQPTAPAPDGVAPTKVFTIDPFTVRPVLEWRKGNRTPQKGEVLQYLQGPRDKIRTIPLTEIRKWIDKDGRKPDGITAVLHPSRVAHFQPYPIAGDEDGLGMSVIEAAYINTLAKMQGDRGAGDYLTWYSRGFYVVNVEFGTDEEIKDTLKMLQASIKARKNFFAGSERSKFDIKTPNAFNPDPFYKQFYIEMAAALEMPTMILMGVQKGTVSGSSVDIIAYFDDVKAFQESHVEPVLQPILVRVVGTDEFGMRWTALFVDKQTQSDTSFKFGQFVAGQVGAQTLTRRQAIAFLRGAMPDLAHALPLPEQVPDEYAEKPEASMVGDKPDNGRPGKNDGDEAETAIGGDE